MGFATISISRNSSSTGRTTEQEVVIGWIQGVHPDDVKGCFEGFLPAFHARKPFRMKYRLRRADGEYRWLMESGIPRYTGAGEFAGYIGSNIDITDLKHAEEERERLHRLEADLAPINEIGRIERTLFMLAWLEDPALRRRVTAGLNRGEARNSLARAVFFNRLGEIRDRSSICIPAGSAA
jgi:hypothetical protein